jgi:hypothetical protein
MEGVVIGKGYGWRIRLPGMEKAAVIYQQLSNNSMMV